MRVGRKDDLFPRMLIRRNGRDVVVELARTGRGIEAHGGGLWWSLTDEEKAEARELLAERDRWMDEVCARVEARKRGEEVPV